MLLLPYNRMLDSEVLAQHIKVYGDLTITGVNT